MKKGHKSKSIREEIARNYSTRGLYNDKPYDMLNNTNLDVEVYSLSDGRWSAQVKCLSNPELTTPVKIFPDQSTADFWARKTADVITRKTMNESIIRHMIRNILIEFVN